VTLNDYRHGAPYIGLFSAVGPAAEILLRGGQPLSFTFRIIFLRMIDR